MRPFTLICFSSPQIAVFSTSPNYEVLFFSSEIHEVIDIVEYLGDGVDPIVVTTKLNEFDVDGKSKISEILLDNTVLIHGLMISACFPVFGLIEQNTAGTDLTQVFEHFLSKMSFIKTRVGAEKFKEHRHVIILFTDGN